MKNRCLNFVKRSKNNDFMAFFVKNLNFLRSIYQGENRKKGFPSNCIDQKSLSLKLYADSNAKNRFCFQPKYF